MSRRTERVGNLIRTIVAREIQAHLSDPRIEPLTSVTRVEVAPDFSSAAVFVSVLAAENRRNLTLRALQHAAGRLRATLADELILRQIPRLVFRLDDSVRKSAEMVNQLDTLMAQLDEKYGAAPPDDSAQEADDEIDTGRAPARRAGENRDVQEDV